MQICKNIKCLSLAGVLIAIPLLYYFVFSAPHIKTPANEFIIKELAFDKTIYDVAQNTIYNTLASALDVENNAQDSAQFHETVNTAKTFYNAADLANVSLEEDFTEKELKNLIRYYQDPKMKAFFITYHEAFNRALINMKNDADRLNKNKNLLLSAKINKAEGEPNYEKHAHFNQKPQDDALAQTLAFMNNNCCKQKEKELSFFADENAKKVAFIKKSVAMDPILANSPKELEKVYESSVDANVMYWAMQENKTLTNSDYKKILKKMKKDKTFLKFNTYLQSMSATLSSHFVMQRLITAQTGDEKPHCCH